MKYSVNKIESFIRNVCIKLGCSSKDTETVADVLLAAELRNISSHGLARLKDYVDLWKNKRLNSKPDIQIVKETKSTCVIDGDKGFGMVVSKFAMGKAIELAENVGTGWVAVRNSNHFGIAGYYSMMALNHDMIGICMTNANPLVAPTFSVDRLLGTNPIAVAIPAGEYPPFVADFATTPIARGKLDLMHKRGEKAPFGYVQDKYGRASDDPNILTEGGAILPLGGDYLHGSHKGYCMSAIVDIFSSLFSGANFGPFVPPSVSYLPVIENSPGRGTGHFFGAISIDAFQTKEEFKSMMDLWIETFSKSNTIEGKEKVIIPGEPERNWEIINRKEGISINEKVKEQLDEIADYLKINKL